MTGRFMLHGLSRMSRSRNLLGSHASAFAKDIAPAIRHASGGGIETRGFYHVPDHRMVVPNLHRIQAYERGIGAHSNLLLQEASAPLTSAVGIHGYASRLIGTLPCSRYATKTSIPTTDLPSTTTQRTQPAFVDSVRGPMLTFASRSSTKDTISWEAKASALKAEMNVQKAGLHPHSAFQAEVEAKKAALDRQAARKAQMESVKKASEDTLIAWRARLDKNAAEFNKIITSLVAVWALAGYYWIFQTIPESSRDGKDERSQQV